MKKPTSVFAGGLVYFFRSLWPFTSGHGSPPAWMSHDDGGGRDGGGSASVSKLRESRRPCQILFLPPVHEQAENECVQVRKPFAVFFAAILILNLAASVCSSQPCAVQRPASRAQIQTRSTARGAHRHQSCQRGRTAQDSRHDAHLGRPHRPLPPLPHQAGPSRSRRASRDVYDRIKDWIIAHRGEQ